MKDVNKLLLPGGTAEWLLLHINLWPLVQFTFYADWLSYNSRGAINGSCNWLLYLPLTEVLLNIHIGALLFGLSLYLPVSLPIHPPSCLLLPIVETHESVTTSFITAVSSETVTKYLNFFHNYDRDCTIYW